MPRESIPNDIVEIIVRLSDKASYFTIGKLLRISTITVKKYCTQKKRRRFL